MSFLTSETAAPSTPATGKVAIYAKTDGKVYQKNDDGIEYCLAGNILKTLTATTSGTSVDFTDIPAGVTKITIMLNGVSTNGTSVPILQIGDSGGVETTGYNCFGSITGNTAASSITSSIGFIFGGNAAANLNYGKIVLSLMDSATNLWSCAVTMGINSSGTGFLVSVGGTKTLTATLDRVRLTTTNGTDTFDAGSANVLYG